MLARLLQYPVQRGGSLEGCLRNGWHTASPHPYCHAHALPVLSAPSARHFDDAASRSAVV